MPRITLRSIPSLLALTALLPVASAGCGGDDAGPVEPEPEPVSSLDFGVSEVRVDVGDTVSVSVTARDGQGNALSGRTVAWRSTDVEIVDVSAEGAVAAVGVGTAHVVATVEGVADSVPAMVSLGRAAAVERVRAELVDTLAASRTVLGFATRDPLPAGTVVRSLNEPDSLPPAFTLADSAYLVYVDLVPSHRMGHPVLYGLVDAATGELSLKGAFGPPAVDGVGRWYDRRARLTSEERFQPRTDSESLPGVVPIDVEWEEDAGSLQAIRTTGRRAFGRLARPTDGPCKKVAVTVASGADDDIKNDVTGMSALLEDLGFDVREFDSATHGLHEVVQGIRDADEGLGPCDKLLIFISSHTQLVDENDDDKPDGGAALRLDYGLGEGEDGGPKGQWIIFPTAGGGRGSVSLPDLLEELGAGHINLVIDACYSESILVHMQRNFELREGVQLDVFTSSARTKTAEGSRVGERIADALGFVDEHGTYYETLEEKLRATDADTDGDGEVSVEEFEEAFKKAHGELEDELSQEPRSGSFQGPEPEPEGPLVDTETTSAVFFHTVGVTDCPQPVGDIEITNLADEASIWTIDTGHPAVVASPSFGTLQPGESVVVSLSFDCTTTESFEVTARITGTNESGTEEAEDTFTIRGEISGG